MKLESIEKLRDEIKHHLIGCEQTWYALADEIEREIERDFMRLPVDSEGVPIRVGDKMEFSYGVDEVEGVHPERIFTLHEGKWLCLMANDKRHAKPDKLKELLSEFLTETACFFPSECGEEIGKYAERIREMAGKGEL